MSYTAPIIYRYIIFSSTTVDLLCSDVQFFAKPTDFNDPFDCSPVIKIDSSLPQLRNLLKTLVFARVRAETLVALKKAKFNGRASDAAWRKFHEKKLVLGHGENPIMEFNNYMDEMRNVFDKEVRGLDAIFDPFLKMSH